MNGIVLTELNQSIITEAVKRGLEVTVCDMRPPTVAYERTLIVGPGVAVPWGLLDAAWHWLEKWEAAAPLWRYGVLAEDVGTEEERERTRALTLDLRLLLYEPSLLFVRRCERGEALLSAWLSECADDAEPHLAFLRALARVKPIFNALSRSWLIGPTAEHEEGAAKRGPVRSMARLIHVEVAPGRSVCCRPEEADMYRQRFAAAALRRDVGR